MNTKIRAVQPHLVEQKGAPYNLLPDQLKLSESSILIPQPLGPLLVLCDGTRDIDELQKALELYAGVQLQRENLEQLISKLDEVLLLENVHSAQAVKISRDGFRAADYRVPALSGGGYPSDPDELKSVLESYIANAPETDPSTGHIRGIISPHKIGRAHV